MLRQKNRFTAVGAVAEEGANGAAVLDAALPGFAKTAKQQTQHQTHGRRPQVPQGCLELQLVVSRPEFEDLRSGRIVADRILRAQIVGESPRSNPTEIGGAKIRQRGRFLLFPVHRIPEGRFHLEIQVAVRIVIARHLPPQERPGGGLPSTEHRPLMPGLPERRDGQHQRREQGIRSPIDASS